ncbi:hypothetical protein Gotur_012684 [Gossypium turneri]
MDSVIQLRQASNPNELPVHYKTQEITQRSQCRIFCCALWAIWGDRNDRVHKKVSKSGKALGRFVNSYISELNEIDKNKSQSSIISRKWRKPPDQFVKINFNAAYDRKYNRATAGIVARDNKGKVLLSCSKNYQQVTSAFAAEALACRKVTKIGIERKWEKIIIEGDSLSIIKKCKSINSLAHTVAKETMKDKVTVYLVGGVPEYAEDQEERDREG